MKKNIREEILETARALFQERGYNSVSMRDIASALGISVGNLTYHFKKKEDLVEGVILEQHKNYRKAQPCGTLEELFAYFRRVATYRASNGYYFRHYTQLAQVCPAVYQLQLSVMEDMKEAIGQSLYNLRESGVIYEAFPGQMESALQTIMIVCLHGVEYYQRIQDSGTSGAMLRSLGVIISGLLTEEGRRKAEFLRNHEFLT